MLLYNRIIKEGTYPESLKESFEVPVYKNGNNNEVKNRPISIINIFSKIFENIIFTKFNLHLTRNIITKSMEE